MSNFVEIQKLRSDNIKEQYLLQVQLLQIDFTVYCRGGNQWPPEGFCGFHDNIIMYQQVLLLKENLFLETTLFKAQKSRNLSQIPG